MDAHGSVYVVGGFFISEDFDPGPANFTLTSAGLTDGFISKFDSLGNFLWAQRIGSDSFDRAYAVTIANDGGTIVGGDFDGTVDFDSGPGSASLTAAGARNGFVLKLDSAGVFQWARGIGGPGHDCVLDLAVDSSGGIYANGFFQSTALLASGATALSLTSAGDYDGFVAKLDEAGGFRWAKSIGGAGTDVSRAIAVSTTGRVFTAGTFMSSVDANPGTTTTTLTATGDRDVFLQVLDTAGAFVRGQRFGGNNYDAPSALSVDSAGAVYITGFFYGACNFDPAGNAPLSATGVGSAGYVSKMDSAGNFIWVYGLGSSSTAIALDKGAAVHCTGQLYATTLFDPNTGLTLTSNGSIDAYVIKIDQDDPTKVVSMPTDAGGPYTLAPNPSRGTVTFRSRNGFLREARIHLLDATGRTLSTWLSKEDNAFEFDVQPFAAGLYWIEVVRADGAVSTTRLVKQ